MLAPTRFPVRPKSGDLTIRAGSGFVQLARSPVAMTFGNTYPDHLGWFNYPQLWR